MTPSTDSKLEAILNSIESLEARVTRIESSSGHTILGERTAPPTTSKRLSLKEFLLEKPPTTDVQRTLAIGYFLETHAGAASFTAAELEKGYRAAKETVPSNISMNIKRCIANGHMMEDDEKKNNKTAYVITRSGEQFVAAEYKKPTGI